MINARILFDGRNILLPNGTGIATYTRNTLSAAKEMQYSTDIITASEFAPNFARPDLNRLMFHDQSYWPRKLSLGSAANFAARCLSYPAGLSAAQMAPPAPHQFIGPEQRGISDTLDQFDNRYVAHHLFDAAYHHAIRYRRLMPVKLSGDVRHEIFHATFPTPIKIKNTPTIVTLHDAIPLVIPSVTKEHLRNYRITLQTILTQADHVLTVSEHSRNDIIRLFDVDEERITNIYQAVHIPQDLINVDLAEIENQLSYFELNCDGYFLFFGALEPKKNVSRLIDAYRRSKAKRPLILVGALGWDYENDLKTIEDPSFQRYRFDGEFITSSPAVRHIRYLPLDQLVTMVRGSRAVLFPSLYEGFGLPAAEAMLMGKPVMASNASSLPEIAGDAALLVNPGNITEMAQGIRQLDNDDDLCAQLSKLGPAQMQRFTMEKYQQRLSEVYGKVM